MNEKIVIGSEEVLMNQVIQEIKNSEPGSKEREGAIKTYQIMMEKINDVDKLQTDLFVKEQDHKMSKKDIIDRIIGVFGVGVTLASLIASIFLAKDAMSLEETGMIKTFSGRKWFGNFRGKVN